MIRAGAGLSSQASTVQAAEDAARQAMVQAGFQRADAALVFFTADHARQPGELLAPLRRVTGTDDICGASASGILTGAGEIEGQSGVAVLVLASDQMAARPFLARPLRERDQEVGAEVARVAAGRTELVALFPDTYNGRPQTLLQAIELQTGFIPVVGAGATEDGTAQATYQLCGGDLTTNAVAGMVLSGSLRASIDITQGCQPIGAPMTITNAENNLIHEIDGRPALEVFAGLLKGPLAHDLRRALTVLFVGLPANAGENSVAGGRYVVRNIIGVDPVKGILGVADQVRPGQAMIFALRDGERAREDLNQMLQRQAERVAGAKPAFGLYFNCCARGASLYGIPGIDAAYIKRALGDFPLIGMFGGYELAPLGGANHLFAYTGVLVLISEPR